MATTVDGQVVQTDSRGITQGNGGDVDKLAGDAGNNKLQGHADFNQYYGGAGNDTFILSAKFGQTQETATKTFSDLAAYVTDFHGAGPNGSGEHDFIALSGFGEGASLQLVGEGASGTAGAKLYYYAVEHNGEFYNFAVNSVNGKALGAGDFQFYG